MVKYEVKSLTAYSVDEIGEMIRSASAHGKLMKVQAVIIVEVEEAEASTLEEIKEVSEQLITE